MDEWASAVQGWVPTAVTGRTEVGIWALVILLNHFVKQRKKSKLLLHKFYCQPFFFARQAICMWWTSKGKWEGSTISEIRKLVEKTASLLHWHLPNKVPSKCHPELWSEDQDLENNFPFFSFFFQKRVTLISVHSLEGGSFLSSFSLPAEGGQSESTRWWRPHRSCSPLLLPVWSESK